ncbi:hypothetical protein KAU15_04540, partial [candidate division WOR-3 bacterium]|nr:hypothetical protein [candidate division WOR-3 bacterium]
MLRRDKNGELKGINTMETEDSNYDGILDNDEDTGLDGVSGNDTQSVSGDDGNDDYYYSSEHPNDYSKINGTENNNTLDTEDKNGDLRLNTESDLYRFTFDLSSNENLIYSHPSSGWKLLRIPLNDPTVMIEGNPDLKYIKTARIMWNGISEKDTLLIYQISMISNKWNNFFTIGSTDNKFYVGAKNNQTDLDYSPPFNPGYDLSGRERKEQSIVLYCDSINGGEGGKVFRYLSRKENFERYKTLSFYMRSTKNDSLTVYIRFGGDSLNVYSISYIPTTTWAYVELPLESLVNLKRDSMDLGGFQNGLYGFRGLPSLTNIGYIEFTVMNNTLSTSVSEIWIDDIMLLEPKREIGIAGDVSGNITVPGILNLSGSFTYRDPFFHRLTDKKGSGSYSQNYNFSSVLNSDKLLPEMFGLNMPINYSYRSGISEPLYKIGSDYKLSEDEIVSNLSLNKTHSASGGISRSKKSTNPFIRYTFDNLRLNGNISNTTRSTYNKIDTTGSYGTNISYGLNPNFKPRKLFNRMNVWLLPSNMSYKVGYSSRWATSYTKSDTAYINTGTSKSENISRNFGLNYKMFPSLSMNYSENRVNDPGFLGSGYTDFLGKDIGKNSTISVTYNPK